MRELTAGDLRKGGGARLPELIVAKLHTLDPNDFVARSVARESRLLLELIRDTLAGRYLELSIPAYAEILLAMHHLVEVRDEIPDTRTGGLVDDLRKIRMVTTKYGVEIETYRRWRAGR